MKALLLVGLLWATDGQIQSFRLQIQPIDYTLGSDADPNSLPHPAKRAVGVGRTIFVSSPQDGHIAIMNPKGEVSGRLGRRGNGPGEFKSGLIGLAAYENHVFAFAHSGRDRLLHFSDGIFVDEIKIHSHNISLGGLNTNRFGVSDEYVLMPVHPATGALAIAYAIDGSHKKPVGELAFGRRDADLLTRIPGLNDTNWTFDGKHWYALFRYEPLIFVFNQSFEQVDAITLSHPRVSLLKEEFVDSANLSNFSTAPSLFYDFAYRNGFLYLLAPQSLFRVSVQTGSIDRIYTFYGKGEEFDHLDSNMQLSFRFFALMPENEVLLGPGFLWDHDLWKVKLPD